MLQECDVVNMSLNDLKSIYEGVEIISQMLNCDELDIVEALYQDGLLTEKLYHDIVNYCNNLED